MRELRHSPEREIIRAECLRLSLQRGVFVDEFGTENPHVGFADSRPAEKGKDNDAQGRCEKAAN